jgi:soluble lytic murein transglycosylase
MQLRPATAAEQAEMMGMTDFVAEDVWRPEVNIALGAFYLNRLYVMFGCVELALAAYNAGQTKVRGWLNNPEFSEDGESLHFIPYPETRNYIPRVLRNQRIYQFILNVTGRAS